MRRACVAASSLARCAAASASARSRSASASAWTRVRSARASASSAAAAPAARSAAMASASRCASSWWAVIASRSLVDACREDGEVAARRGHVAALHRRRSHRPQEGAVAARVPGALGEDAEQEQRDPEGADDLGARDGALRRGGVHGPAERDVQDERRSSLNRRDAHEQVHPPVAGDAGLHGERAEAAPELRGCARDRTVRDVHRKAGPPADGGHPGGVERPQGDQRPGGRPAAVAPDHGRRAVQVVRCRRGEHAARCLVGDHRRPREAGGEAGRHGPVARPASRPCRRRRPCRPGRRARLRRSRSSCASSGAGTLRRHPRHRGGRWRCRRRPTGRSSARNSRSATPRSRGSCGSGRPGC